MKKTLINSALALALTTGVAQAHASLAVKSAKINSTYKAVVGIAHGCEGHATLKVSITIPEGIIAAKPMPKAGWTLETEKSAYAKTYDYHGPKSEGVTKITWTGELANDHFDEFIFRARITDAFEAGKTVYFPVVQECTAGQNAWIEIPTGDDHPKHPAPGLKLLDADAHAHTH